MASIIKNKKGVESIFTTFVLIVTIVGIAIGFTYIAYSTLVLRGSIEVNLEKYEDAQNARDAITSCLYDNDGNIALVEACLPTTFIGGYIEGFTIEEVYGEDCTEDYVVGKSSSDILIYWINIGTDKPCLSKLKIAL